MSSSAAFGLLSIQKSFFEPGKIFILDFGGACGAHYFLARAFFQKECRLFWSVVETRKMCDYGRHLENDELHFFVDIESAIASMPRIDLVHTSGTLQCVDEPERYLGKLVSCAGRHLLFNRTGFTKGRHNVIAIHESLLSENGIGPLPLRFADAKIRYPFTFMRKEIFDAVVNQDYAIVMESNDDTGILAVNDEPIIGGSLFYQLKSLIGQQTVFSGSAASSNVSAKSDLSE
jgi:putative methyltransferase (TIGR04325 family)